MGEETKNKALAQASFREKIIAIQSQRKAKPKYGICAGFWFGSSWAQSQAVRRSIYIYFSSSSSLYFSFFFFFFFFHTMVSRFCIENRLSFLFLVRVHHTHVRCNLVRKLARTVFMLASVEQSRFFMRMQQRLLFLSFVFCN